MEVPCIDRSSLWSVPTPGGVRRVRDESDCQFTPAAFENPIEAEARKPDINHGDASSVENPPKTPPPSLLPTTVTRFPPSVGETLEMR